MDAAIFLSKEKCGETYKNFQILLASPYGNSQPFPEGTGVSWHNQNVKIRSSVVIIDVLSINFKLLNWQEIGRETFLFLTTLILKRGCIVDE